jgi:AraC-like DNA-binding protein
MKKLKLIPTPQYVDYKKGKPLSINKVYVCKCVGNSVDTALELLAKKTDFVLNVCRYLKNTDDIRLEHVSHYFGYSPEHFSRKFHAELGVSFKRYCEQILIQRSLDYFDKPNISLGEIAEILGYSDASSFIRAFKRIYGITPGNYRRMRNPSR